MESVCEDILPFRKLPDLWDPHVLVKVLQNIHDTLKEISNFSVLSAPGHGSARTEVETRNQTLKTQDRDVG